MVHASARRPLASIWFRPPEKNTNMASGDKFIFSTNMGKQKILLSNWKLGSAEARGCGDCEGNGGEQTYGEVGSRSTTDLLFSDTCHKEAGGIKMHNETMIERRAVRKTHHARCCNRVWPLKQIPLPPPPLVSKPPTPPSSPARPRHRSPKSAPARGSGGEAPQCHPAP